MDITNSSGTVTRVIEGLMTVGTTYNNKEKYNMSSEAIAQQQHKVRLQEAVFTIDGKDYKKSDLNTKTYNSIVVRQDLQATKLNYL